MNITSKELALLNIIAKSEYQDGANPIGHHVWLDYIVNSQSEGGVLASLHKKGLIALVLIDKEHSDNWQNNRITDSTVAITAAGGNFIAEIAN